MIEVRDANTGDADAIATAHIDGWRVAYRGLLPDEYLDATEFATSRRDRWRAWAWKSVTDSCLFVVTIDKRVGGFCHAGPEQVQPERYQSAAPASPVPAGTGRGEVYAFYLHPSAWGSGGAGALMSRCEEFLRDEGYGTAILWVLRDNPRARSFYEKAGWHPTGRTSSFVLPNVPGTSLPEVEYEVRL